MFLRPFSHHPNKLELVRHFTPNWFTVTMGTGVLALLLNQLSDAAWVHGLAVNIWRANIGLFSLFTLLYAARWILFPREAARIFSHPVAVMFLGAIPMGLATIINGIAVFAHNYETALWLWEVDAALSVAVGMGVPFAMFTRQRHDLASMTAIWLLPIVACEVAAASAGLLAPYLPAQSLNLVMAGYALWALSVPLALSILVILFLRLILHKLPAPEMGVSSWLAVGPLGTGALGLLLLGKAAPAAFSTAGLPAAFGMVAQGAGLIGGLMIWAYGAWWLAMAVAMTLSHLPNRLPFNMGWWGFTFPLGVFILATNALAAQTGLAAFAIAGQDLTCLFILLWLVVALRTLAGAYQGHLFTAPCLKSQA